jgi:hypothetical protein
VQKNAKKRAKRTANLKKKIMVRRSSRRNVQIRGFFARNSSFKARSSEETDKLTGITPLHASVIEARQRGEIANFKGRNREL